MGIEVRHQLIGVIDHGTTGDHDTVLAQICVVQFQILAVSAVVGGRNEGSSMAPSNNSYADMPASDPIDMMPEYDIPTSDPYENYDKEVSLSDNDLPF